MSTFYRCSNGHVFSLPSEAVPDEPNEAVSQIINTDLTPEQLTQLDEIVDYHEPEESEYLGRLNTLGYHARAERAKDCGKYFRFYKHDAKNGQPEHTWKSPSSRCMQRSCPVDAKVEAFKHLQRYLPVEQLVESHFTHIEILFPLNNEDPQVTNNLIKNLQKTLTKTLPHKGTLSKVGYRGEQMILKVLQCNAIDNKVRVALTTVMATFGATVTMAIYHKDLFTKILKSVMRMEIPYKDRARAEFEAALAFIKQITSVGVPKQIVYGESPYTNTIRVEHPTDDNLTVDLKIKPCPKCGQAPDYLSEWCTNSDSVDKLRKVRWQYRVPPAKPSAVN